MKKLDRNDPHTRRILTASAFFLILVIGMIYSSRRGEVSDTTYLSFWSSGCFTVADQDQKREKVSYDEIREAVFEAEPEYGEPVKGTTKDGMRLGIWESPTLGSYWNCTDVKVKSCVWVKTDDRTYAINVESDETTRALYEAILKAMANVSE